MSENGKTPDEWDGLVDSTLEEEIMQVDIAELFVPW